LRLQNIFFVSQQTAGRTKPSQAPGTALLRHSVSTLNITHASILAPCPNCYTPCPEADIHEDGKYGVCRCWITA